MLVYGLGRLGDCQMNVLLYQSHLVDLRSVSASISQDVLGCSCHIQDFLSQNQVLLGVLIGTHKVVDHRQKYGGTCGPTNRLVEEVPGTLF